MVEDLVIKKVSTKPRSLARRIIDGISRGLALIGMWLIVAMGVMIIGDITLRASGHPFLGTLQITELLLCICVFTTTSQTWRMDGHVRVMLFFDRCKPRTRIWLEILASLLGVLLFALIAWRNYGMILLSYRLHDVTWVPRIPIFPVYIFITFGTLMLTVQMLTTLSSNLSKLVKKEPAVS